MLMITLYILVFIKIMNTSPRTSKISGMWFIRIERAKVHGEMWNKWLSVLKKKKKTVGFLYLKINVQLYITVSSSLSLSLSPLPLAFADFYCFSLILMILSSISMQVTFMHIPCSMENSLPFEGFNLQPSTSCQAKAKGRVDDLIT